MTWGEFKKMVEELGVKDDSSIAYIDWSGWSEAYLLEYKDGSIAIA